MKRRGCRTYSRLRALENIMEWGGEVKERRKRLRCAKMGAGIGNVEGGVPDLRSTGGEAEYG